MHLYILLYFFLKIVYEMIKSYICNPLSLKQWISAVKEIMCWSMLEFMNLLCFQTLQMCTRHSLIATFFLSVIQVFYVIVQFGGLLPETVLIQRRKLDPADLGGDDRTEQPWLDWQYMARNCSVFQMQNNGPLLKSDSVNCMQLPK